MDIGWVKPWVTLGWVGLGPAKNLMFFYSYVTGLFVTYFLTVIPNKRNHIHLYGTVSLCTDMYTDDYRKQSYLDVYVSWINRQFQKHHAALAVRHFGHRGSYWRL